MVDWLGMVDWGMMSPKTWSNDLTMFVAINQRMMKPPNWGVAEAREAMLRARKLKA